MKRFLVLLGSSAILVLVASPAYSTPVKAQLDPGNGDQLVVAEETTRRVSATFSRSTTFVSLDATVDQDGPISSSIKVGRTQLRAERDQGSGEVRWTGGGAVLSPTEREALRSLAAQVNAKWLAPTGEKSGELSEPVDLMVRLVMVAADAPPGHVLSKRTVKQPTTIRVETAADLPRPGTLEVRCEDGAGSLTKAQAAACQQSDEDGIYYMSCSTLIRGLTHDANHCFIVEGISSGPGSSGCVGECGPGCNGIDTYTYDCGDHDRCGRAHNDSYGTGGPCGDEWNEAQNDFFHAPINRCRGRTRASSLW